MRRDERPTFFVDASLGRHVVPNALRQAGIEVVVHDDRFPQATPDEQWLAEAGRQGWVVLTKDKKIRYREIERRALRRARVAAFVFTGTNLMGEEIAAALVRALPRMLRLSRKTRPPFIAAVTAGGNVRLIE